MSEQPRQPAHRTSSAIEARRPPPPPPVHNGVGIPRFELLEGPYAGRTTLARGDGIDDVLFFPHEVHVRGRDGWAIYTLTERDGERVAVFDHYG